MYCHYNIWNIKKLTSHAQNLHFQNWPRPGAKLHIFSAWIAFSCLSSYKCSTSWRMSIGHVRQTECELQLLRADSMDFIINSWVLGVGRGRPIWPYSIFLWFALSSPSTIFFLLFSIHSENPIQSLNHVFISFCICFYCNRAWQNHYVIGLVCSCQRKHIPSATTGCAMSVMCDKCIYLFGIPFRKPLAFARRSVDIIFLWHNSTYSHRWFVCVDSDTVLISGSIRNGTNERTHSVSCLGGRAVADGICRWDKLNRPFCNGQMQRAAHINFVQENMKKEKKQEVEISFYNLFV